MSDLKSPRDRRTADKRERIVECAMRHFAERGYEGVLAIRASANGVRLYFNRGKGLPDPAKLLRGSGKQTRWIHLEGASTLARPAVARLIDEAIARNRVPFARTGRGPVVIRSVSAKQRRRRRPAKQTSCSEPGDDTPVGNRGSVAPGH